MVGLIGRVTTIAVAALGSLLLIGTGIAAAGTQPGQLDPGDTLYPGQSIVSPNGQWSLEMQTDGNLVLYAPRHSAIAESRTAGEPEVILQMQRDGNLVLRAKGNRPIAASSTEDHPGTVLQVQDDGGVVLYAPGHQALRVVVPAADFVNTPMPGQPAPVDSPKPDSQGDPGAVGGDAGEVASVTRTVACAGGGKAVASKLPKIGDGVDVACGILSDDSGRPVDGYLITRTIGCALLGPIGPACDILTEDSAAN